MTPDGFGSIRDHDAIRIGKGMLYAALPQDGHVPCGTSTVEAAITERPC